MRVFNSALYVGTDSQGVPCEVWRLSGSTWTMVNIPGFGNRNNTGVSAMAVYGGKLYAGTFNPDGCEVWRYKGTSWEMVSSSSPVRIQSEATPIECATNANGGDASVAMLHGR